MCCVLSWSPRRVTQGHHCPANRGSDAGPLLGSSLGVTPQPPTMGGAGSLSPRLSPTPNTLLPGKHPLPQWHWKQRVRPARCAPPTLPPGLGFSLAAPLGQQDAGPGVHRDEASANAFARDRPGVSPGREELSASW